MPAVGVNKAPTNPPYPREVRLGALEWIGIPLLALLPLLALTGALGPSSARLATPLPEAGLRLDLTYPTRLRLKADGEMQLLVHNTGSTTQAGLTLSLDQRYLQAFGRVQSLPAPQQLSATALRIALPALPAGESALVRLMFEADSWGRQPGWLALDKEDGTSLARLDFHTLVLP